ncbi:hypothetical protein D932_02333 [Enterococcus casseliflavus 14-MB-W-14]|nr:hypothetical protein D932_02333 [Enterococcus casseliflavus 14-MB-W-14]
MIQNEGFSRWERVREFLRFFIRSKAPSIFDGIQVKFKLKSGNLTKLLAKTPFFYLLFNIFFLFFYKGF